MDFLEQLRMLHLRAATNVDEAKRGLAEEFRVTKEDGSSLLADTIEVKRRRILHDA